MATAFDLLTVEEAAEYLRLSPFTVRKMLREGHLRGVKVGKRQWRISRADLQSYLATEPQVPDNTAKPKWLILAEEQGVGPVTDFDALLGHGWPEDEPVEDFIEALNEWRSQPYTPPLLD
jgi:excisionase family DNA binding protein